MPGFCPGCGAQIQANVAFCPSCGRATGQAAQAAPPPPPQAAGAPSAYAAPAAAAPVVASAPLADNIAGALAYVTFIPAILFLVMEPYNKNKFVRFHSFQCLFLTAVWVVLAVALQIGIGILGFIPFLGFYFWLMVWRLFRLAGLVLGIFLLWNAYQGKMFKLPIVGDLAEKQANAI